MSYAIKENSVGIVHRAFYSICDTGRLSQWHTVERSYGVIIFFRRIS